MTDDDDMMMMMMADDACVYMQTCDLAKLGDPCVCFERFASSHVPLAPAVSQGVMSFGASLPELVPVVINNRCRTTFQAPSLTST